MNKYNRKVICPTVVGSIDVYSVLDAFEVTCPALQHAIKKLLCAGLRGHKSTCADLREARQALDRALEMEIYRRLPQAQYDDGGE